jgi:hypothetical protein
MLFREKTAVCFENHMKHRNTELMKQKVALKGQKTENKINGKPIT